MRGLLLLPVFLTSLVYGAVWDVEGMYAQARTMLEDRSIEDVSGVTAMLEECARAGYEPAKLLLLDVYEGRRNGLAANPEKAFALACEMAEAELPSHAKPEEVAARREAMYRRALYYERGTGCPASPTEAYQWMRRAAAEGYAKAQVELARYLFNGVGHAPDARTALRNLLYVHRHAPDTPNLYFYLGHMCRNGLGMRRPNLLMARRFYELGARRGDARALNCLGSMYELGVGVARDGGRALRLYKQAAARGCKDASANMQRLAFKTDRAEPQSAPWQQRVGGAWLRVVQALPVSAEMRRWLGLPVEHLRAES